MNPIEDLRARARAKGIFMQAICEEAGIHQSQASRWLNGKVRPYWDSVQAMEEAFQRLTLRLVQDQVGQAMQAAGQLGPWRPGQTAQIQPETSADEPQSGQ